MKIYELLSDESKWVQGTNATDKDGNIVSSLSNKACKWCLLGATIKCYPGFMWTEIAKKISDYLIISGNMNESISFFNDTRSYEEVVSVARHLDV